MSDNARLGAETSSAVRCASCKHWGVSLGPVTEGFCEIFNKVTAESHGGKCTAFAALPNEPTEQLQGREHNTMSESHELERQRNEQDEFNDLRSTIKALCIENALLRDSILRIENAAYRVQDWSGCSLGEVIEDAKNITHATTNTFNP